MPGYNKTFELTPDELDLIEVALRDVQKRLSEKSIAAKCDKSDETLRETHELLGRLHNQKNFYRPKAGSYIGG